ncbi:MAG TPA: hypothetical protein VLA82_14275 [Actinomycetota bacterium]|nr:hypothetical protein [Actinomycetota bacterium]
MDDYSALAQRVAVTVGDARGCLVLSRDGLVLGAYPEDESAIKPAWLKFATLGEPQKSFVEFGDQIWAYVHRGAYAAFIVAGASVRPGVLIDQMEQALLAAEDARTRREPLKLPDATGAPSGKPRTSLHPPVDRQEPAEVTAAPSEDDRRRWARGTPDAPDGGGQDASAGRAAADGSTPEAPAPDAAAADGATPDGPAAEPTGQGADAAADASVSALRREPQQLVGGSHAADEEEGEIDRVLLAKEFSGLLQLDSDGDEESS